MRGLLGVLADYCLALRGSISMRIRRHDPRERLAWVAASAAALLAFGFFWAVVGEPASEPESTAPSAVGVSPDDDRDHGETSGSTADGDEQTPDTPAEPVDAEPMDSDPPTAPEHDEDGEHGETNLAGPVLPGTSASDDGQPAVPIARTPTPRGQPAATTSTTAPGSSTTSTTAPPEQGSGGLLGGLLDALGDLLG